LSRPELKLRVVEKNAGRTLSVLDLLNFFLAEVATGVGPFLAIRSIFFFVALLASWAGRRAGTWGRKPLLLGAISTAVGVGASLSQVIAGSIAHRLGFNAGFLFLAAIAAGAFSILYFFMPETRDGRRREKT